MHNWIKMLIAATITLLILISCKSLDGTNGEEYSISEYDVSTSLLDSEGGRDTVPDPEEPEIPEDPDPEEEPEEEPEPIPDTIGVWRIK